ncbi:MAG: WD40 repeat domain-containing protein [Leptolyngbyaceae cyanobacterium RU_5_1]|nr:WD40 repeat domain-containing protein [Leptolyngbyaceae cyanobacterium RU_5_1]
MGHLHLILWGIPPLTLQGYAAIDGVKGALQRWADQFYTNLSAEDQTFVREMVSELVNIEDTGEVTRRRATWERLRDIATSQEQLERIIGQLVYQRLLVADTKTVEVAHEALLSESRLIRGWIEENRDSIRLQQRLESYRREWQEHNQSENYLLDVGRLAAIEEWIERKQPRLMNIDREFVERSKARRDREIQAQLEQERKLREAAEAKAKAEEEKKLIEIEKSLEADARAKAEAEKAQEAGKRVKVEKQRNRSLSIAAVLLAGLAVVTFGLKQRAEQREQEAINALTARPEELFQTGNQLEALIESVKVLKELKQIGGNQSSALVRLQTVVYGVKERNRLEGHESNGIFGVSFSRDGQKIASAGGDRTIRLWSRAGKPLLNKPLLHGSKVWSVSFSHTGKGELLASGDANGKIYLWNSQDGSLQRKFPVKDRQQKDNAVLKLSFSPDDRLIAAAVYSDKAVEIWRVADGQLLKIIPQAMGVTSVDFGADSQTVATAGEDGKIRIWRVSDSKLLKTLSHNRLIYDIKLHRKGMVVSGGEDEQVKIWRTADGQLLKSFSNQDTVYGVAFSIDGEFVAAGGAGKIVRIWRVADSQAIASLPNKDLANRVNFSPDGQLLASTGDSLIRFWSLDLNQTQQTSLDGMLRDACRFLNDYLSSSTSLPQDDRRVCDSI